MNRIDDETLQAYVDGELDAVAAARVDAALAHDGELARQVAQARAVRARLRAGFDPVLDEPVPERLSAMLRSAAPRTPSADAHPMHAARMRRRWFVPGLALAASLVLVAVALWSWRSDDRLVRMQDGRAFAAGALDRALDHALASEPDAHAPIAIGLSFRSNGGRICRTFVVRSQPARAGLACHGGAGWILPVIAPAAAAEEGPMRQAASALPPVVQAAVDARLHGDVFDARQERAARDAGWR